MSAQLSQHVFQPEKAGQAIRLAFLSLKGVECDSGLVRDIPEPIMPRLIVDVEVGFNDAKTRFPNAGFDFNHADVRAAIRDACSYPSTHLETIAHRIAENVLVVLGALTCSVTVSEHRRWPDVEQSSIRIYREA